MIVGEGSVLSMGVYLGASTTIIDRATGEISWPGAALLRGGVGHHAGQAAAGRPAGPNRSIAPLSSSPLTPSTRAKTSINELLRD